MFIMYYNFIGGVAQAHEKAVDKYSNGKLPYLCVINTVHDYTIILKSLIALWHSQYRY